MIRLRLRTSRTVAFGIFVAFTGLLLLAATVMAEGPARVDSYGGNAFASGVHVIVGSNNDPNFPNGAIGNRYPLAQAGQDISPASSATASIDDYGPLVSTVLGNDCNAPPPSPIPPSSPQPSPNYCLEQVRSAVPYARAQFPHPPGAGDQTVNGPGNSSTTSLPATGTATAHAEELAAHADGVYTGSPDGATFTNATAHSATGVASDGSITVTTPSHVGSACFGSCGVSNWLQGTNTGVTTIVTAVNGKPVPRAVVAPGRVEFCQAPGNCQSVQLDNTGVTVGGVTPPAPPPPVPGIPTSVPVPGTGASAETPLFKVRTINPIKSVNGSTGSIDALGLDIEVMQPGNSGSGVPDSQVEFILGEGHADGFSLASLGIGDTGITALSGGGDTGALLGSIVGDNPGGSAAGVTLPAIKHTVIRPGGLALAGALRPPFIPWFYAWEASALAAAASMVWARRSRLREIAEEALGQ